MISRLVVGHAEKIENIFTFFGIGLPVGLIFFLITAALSTAAVFLKQRKEEPAKESAQEESIKELKEENGEEAEAREVEAYEVEVEKIN